MDFDRPIEECVEACFPRSHALLEGAWHSLFYSLPVAFDPALGEGCYLATVDRDEHGEPWRFIDMGAMIATRAFGENDPKLTAAILADLEAVGILEASVEDILAAGRPCHWARSCAWVP